jgi:Fe-S-cluster containining protein
MNPPVPATGACTACGVCCARYRVDFDRGACDDAPGGFVPAGLAEALNARLCPMNGTDRQPPRCAPLSGCVGVQVRCGIYAHRPSPCRELEAGSMACSQARRFHSLPPLG